MGYKNPRGFVFWEGFSRGGQAHKQAQFPDVCYVVVLSFFLIPFFDKTKHGQCQVTHITPIISARVAVLTLESTLRT